MANKMTIKEGNVVKLDYEGFFDGGEIFDSSKHGDHSHPLEFEVGAGQVIPGFDSAVIGMEVDQEKEFSIEAKDAYGEYREELKQRIPKDRLPQDQEPKEGMMLMVGSPDGKQFPVKISAVEENEIVVDFNHPLAGKKLNFKIKILEVSEK